MLHWDGTSWTQVPFPAPFDTSLAGVSAVSPSSAWAVGRAGIFGSTQPVIMHWDGTSWAQMASPSFGIGIGSWLDAVVATSDTNVFVLGVYPNDYFKLTPLLVPLVLHWDGSSWTSAALQVPGQGIHTRSWALGVTAAGLAWVAGSGDGGDGPYTPYAAPAAAVPNLSGDRVGEAMATLQTYGLTGSSALNQTMNCPASSYGLIVGQDPAPGQQEPFGFAVSLTKCVNPPTVAVPNVLSEDNTSARNAITAAGLTVGSVSMVANCTASFGVVLNQNPNGGVQVAPGSTVNLTESTGKQANGRPCIQD
jgi:PASTA domain